MREHIGDALSDTNASHFGIHRLDRGLDVAVTKSKSLEAARIIRVTRHVIGTDRSGELGVAQHPHDGEEIHHPFVGINLFELVQATANVAHVDLVDLSTPAQVFDNRRNLRVWILQPFRGRSETQLESVVRTVHNRFVTFKGFEDRG